MFCRKRRTPPETDEPRKTSRLEPHTNNEKHKGHGGKPSVDKCETEVFVVKQIQCDHDPFWDIPGYQRDNGEFVLRCRRCGVEL